LTIIFFEGMSHSEQFLNCFSLSKGRWVVVAMRSIFVAISRSATWEFFISKEDGKPWQSLYDNPKKTELNPTSWPRGTNFHIHHTPLLSQLKWL